MSFPQEVNGPLNSWNHLEISECFKVNARYAQPTPRNKVTFLEVHRKVSGHFLERSFMYTVTLVTALAGCAEWGLNGQWSVYVNPCMVH